MNHVGKLISDEASSAVAADAARRLGRDDAGQAWADGAVYESLAARAIRPANGQTGDAVFCTGRV